MTALLRRATTLVVVLALATFALVAVQTVTAPAAKAEYTSSGYYKTTYSATIYRYVNYGSSGFHYPIDYAAWRAAGFPRPVIAGSTVVKYAWSPTLYAVTFFAGDWLWDRLTPAQWAATGYLFPANAGWIQYSYITQYGSGSELFLHGEDGSVHKLSYAEWAATPYRQAETFDLSTGFFQRAGNPAIYQAYNYGTNGEVSYQIDFSTWAGYQFPTPAQR